MEKRCVSLEEYQRILEQLIAHQQEINSLKQGFSVMKIRLEQEEKRAFHAENALKGLHDSRSWKITRPLRLVMGFARRLKIVIKQKKGLSVLFSHIFRQVFSFSIIFVQRRPRLKGNLIKILSRFPSLKRFLIEERHKLKDRSSINENVLVRGPLSLEYLRFQKDFDLELRRRNMRGINR